MSSYSTCISLSIDSLHFLNSSQSRSNIFTSLFKFYVDFVKTPVFSFFELTSLDNLETSSPL